VLSEKVSDSRAKGDRWLGVEETSQGFIARGGHLRYSGSAGPGAEIL